MTAYQKKWSKLAFNRVSVEATRTILRHIEVQGELGPEPMFIQSRIEDAMTIAASLMIKTETGWRTKILTSKPAPWPTPGTPAHSTCQPDKIKGGCGCCNYKGVIEKDGISQPCHCLENLR